MKFYAIKAVKLENKKWKRSIIAIYSTEEAARKHKEELDNEDKEQRKEIAEEWREMGISSPASERDFLTFADEWPPYNKAQIVPFEEGTVPD